MSFVVNASAPIGQPFAPLKIRTAGKDVVASGTVITGDNKDVEFQLANIQVRLNFLSDGGAHPRMEPAPAAGSLLALSLYNFNNSIGAGTTDPIEIGNLAGRKLLFSFIVYAMTRESTKTVHYTFLVGDPI